MWYESAKKKKKTVLIISGILVIASISAVVYFAWFKSKTTEHKEPTNSKQQIQQLQSQLSSLKSKLNNLSDTTQKTQLESKLTAIENKVNEVAKTKNSPPPSTIKQLEQEIKELKKKLENNKPDENPEPNNKKEERLAYNYPLTGENTGYYVFDNSFMPSGDRKIFYISQNHPQIKKLLSQGKLQGNKQFIIRYGKIDKESSGKSILTFNESNKELEIVEVENPSPEPNPNPQPDNKKGFNFVSTKINDNTYKYKITLDGGEIDFSDFITLLKDKKEDFFKAFQGALKDANSKFPAYFWKCPPVSLKTLDKNFEFVVIKSDTLNNITQDYSSFQEHFGKSRDNQAVSFSSPSGNVLISPVPKGTADYKNISEFTKNAPDEQQQALWKEVADSLMKELEKNTDAPRWLNTEGRSVPYLHVRIDKKNGFYSNYPEYAKWE